MIDAESIAGVFLWAPKLKGEIRLRKFFALFLALCLALAAFGALHAEAAAPAVTASPNPAVAGQPVTIAPLVLK